ncbi:MAG: hypothetical protein ACOZF0_10005 [Thermodesulfobacteriota bacterium]
MDADQLRPAHFGCLQEEALVTSPDEIANTCHVWLEVYAEAEAKGCLADIRGLKERLIQEAGVVLPDLELSAKPQNGS